MDMMPGLREGRKTKQCYRPRTRPVSVRPVTARLQNGYESLENHEHALARFEIGGERHDLLAAFSADQVGDRQEVAVPTQSLGHTVYIQERRVPQHDRVYPGAELGRGAAHDLDGVVRRKLEQSRAANHGVPANSRL